MGGNQPSKYFLPLEVITMTQTILESIGNTPLLTLANFSAGAGATILGKQESRNPAGSVKCRIAVSMIEAAEKDGSVTERDDYH